MGAFLAGAISLVINVVSVVLIAYALISFTPLDPWHPIRRFLDRIAEPLVRPFRNVVPSVGGLDFSVMVALIVVQLVGRLLIVLVNSISW